MTRAHRRTGLTGCAALASALLLVSCSSGADKGKDTDHSPLPVPSRSASAGSTDEKRLTEQAQAALAAVHSGQLVESGAERVTDGIHTEPDLTKGKAYKIYVVCYGSGSARLTLKPASAGSTTTVPCDQSVVQQRITGQKPLRMDVDGAQGATGVIAWRIDAV
ncbi:hypothetical protein [Streptomyces sp. NPDC014006]|uniref:hypothetical protein n=1 Tax=Streptomyces sp. NPDC014006 TaxID=3364870 RepID=UPI0036F52B03